MTILKGQLPHTTHSYTKHSHKKKRVEKEGQQKKATSIKQRKAILALSCLIIYSLKFHPLKKHKANQRFYKDYKASKGFGDTGEQQLYYYTVADPELQNFFGPSGAASVWSKNKRGAGLPRPLPQICHCYIQSGPLTIALLQFPKTSFAQLVGTSKYL